MRDVNRIPQILKRLEDLWKKYPDLRLGQLIGNVIQDPALYYVEDEKLMKARIMLIKATKITLKNALDVLGISAPDRM